MFDLSVFSSRRLATVAAVSLAGLTSQAALAGPMGYALADGGTTLVGFDLTNPGMTMTTALSGGRLDAIDFRPATGQLYGYDDVTDSYFVVNTNDGVLTSATGTVTPTDTPDLDIDWNPTIDRMRTVTATDQNIVYNPNNGDASNAATTPLFYGVGDANEGADPNIVANGYTNSFAGATTTTQYALDSDLDILTTLANNAGTLATIGNLGLDFGDGAGLDILAMNGMNMAYALLNSGGMSGLYTIDLGSGAATAVGMFDPGLGELTGLAVTVPEPSVLLLFGGGALLLGGRLRARQAAA